MFAVARGGARRGPARRFEGEDLSAGDRCRAGSACFAHHHACNDAAKGTKTRVHLPTGKDVEVKIPAGIASGQQIRLKGQGWPSASGRAGDALITVNVAAAFPVQAGWQPTCGSSCRSRSMKRRWCAKMPSFRRSTAQSRWRSPAGTNSGRTFRLQGQGPKGKGRQRRSARDRTHYAA